MDPKFELNLVVFRSCIQFMFIMFFWLCPRLLYARSISSPHCNKHKMFLRCNIDLCRMDIATRMEMVSWVAHAHSYTSQMSHIKTTIQVCFPIIAICVWPMFIAPTIGPTLVVIMQLQPTGWQMPPLPIAPTT